MSGRNIRVDIVSDVVCPWCIVGYKQFEQALASLPEGVEVSVHWQPYELNPQMRPDGQNLREHLAEKAAVSAQQSQAVRAQLTSLGNSLGFDFDFFDEMRVYNTFNAHQLLHWAGEHGLQTELKLALFSAHFAERKNVGDIDALVQAAANVGLLEAEAREVLNDQRYAAAVRDQEKLWQDRDVRGVPAFIFNERYSVMGAQSADSFVQVLNKLVAP